MKKRATYSTHSGFTLIELLVVIVIIGVLATLATVAVSSARTKARDARRLSDIKQIQTALELYLADHNTYPTTLTFGAPLISPDGIKTYMSKVPNDPAPSTDATAPVNDYSYGYTTATNRYSLGFSLSKDTADLKAGVNLVSPVGINDGLIGRWSLNNSTVDLAANGNDGTWSGTSTVRYATVNGKNSAYFNGVNDKIDMTDAPSLRPTTEITMSAWVNFTATPSSGAKNIINKGRQAAAYGLYSIDFNGTNNAWTMYIVGNSAMDSTGFVQVPTLNTWYHVVGTFNKGVFKIYLNGQKKSEKTSATVFTIYTDGYIFGLGRYNLGAYFMEGYLRDARIYNRALDDGEISALYEAEK